MSLEDLTGTGKGIDSLVITNPDGLDPKSEGDNHIRGLKNILQNVFGLMPSKTVSLPATGNVLTYDGTKYAPAAIPPASVASALSGSVLQMGAATDVGGSTSGLAFGNLTGITKTITPKSAASVLLISVEFHAEIASLAGVNVFATYQLHEAGAPIGYPAFIAAVSGAGGNGFQSRIALTYSLANTALAARGFLLYGKTSNVGALVTASAQVWTLTEVKN